MYLLRNEFNHIKLASRHSMFIIKDETSTAIRYIIFNLVFVFCDLVKHSSSTYMHIIFKYNKRNLVIS